MYGYETFCVTLVNIGSLESSAIAFNPHGESSVKGHNKSLRYFYPEIDPYLSHSTF
jgi:hypothetical protein